MQLVKMKKNHEQFVRDMVYRVENNKAHYLVDNGFAVIYKEKEVVKPRRNKMVGKKKNKVNTK